MKNLKQAILRLESLNKHIIWNKAFDRPEIMNEIETTIKLLKKNKVFEVKLF